MPSISDNSGYNPSLVFIETTTACDYACRHCRAESQSNQAEDDLTGPEIFGLMDQIRSDFSPVPEVILTGGNLLLRPDVREIISYANRIGLPFSVSPAGSALLTEDFLLFLKRNRTGSISLSLDGTADGSHDWLRMKSGSFRLTVDILRKAREIGLKVQINTTVMANNVNELPSIASIARTLGVSAWELFFLIKTGRGTSIDEVDRHQYMQINNWLADLPDYGISVRTVEGPVMRVIKSMRSLEPDAVDGPVYRELKRKTQAIMGLPPETGTEGLMHSGNGSHGRFRGTLFVSHNGTVFPTGLLPYRLGSIREEKLKDITGRRPEVLLPRNSGLIEGKCGHCNFVSICGGSRARAYSHTGNPFSEDPACLHVPAGLRQEAS